MNDMYSEINEEIKIIQKRITQDDSRVNDYRNRIVMDLYKVRESLMMDDVGKLDVVIQSKNNYVEYYKLMNLPKQIGVWRRTNTYQISKPFVDDGQPEDESFLIDLDRILYDDAMVRAIEKHKGGIYVPQFKNNNPNIVGNLERIDRVLDGYSNNVTFDPIEVSTKFDSSGRTIYEVINGRHRVVATVIIGKRNIRAKNILYR